MIFASEGLVKFSFYWLADCSNFENADTMRTRKTKNRVGLSSDAVSGAQDKTRTCTAERPLPPQSSVYTNFTTAATTYYNLPYFLGKNKTPIVASSFFQDHLSYMVYFDIHNS